VVPGDERPAYAHAAQARQILNDAEDDLREWRPELDDDEPYHEDQNPPQPQGGTTTMSGGLQGREQQDKETLTSEVAGGEGSGKAAAGGETGKITARPKGKGKSGGAEEYSQGSRPLHEESSAASPRRSSGGGAGTRAGTGAEGGSSQFELSA